MQAPEACDLENFLASMGARVVFGGLDILNIKGRAILNRPGIAGAVQQTPSSLNNSLTDSAFASKSSLHYKS